MVHRTSASPGKKQENSPIPAGRKFRRSVGPERSRQQVAIFEAVIDPPKNRLQRIVTAPAIRRPMFVADTMVLA